MEGMTIRPATIEDLPALLSFEQGVIGAERPFDPTLKADPISYYDLPQMISSEWVHLLVAEKDTALIASGYCRIEEAKPYLRHSRHGYLGFMYVVPGYRGKGINRAIIEGLSAWAREQKMTELRLDVYSQNAAAVRAYEKAGLVSHMLEMRRQL